MIEISKKLLSEVLEYNVYDYALKNTNVKLNKITTSTLCNEPRIIGYEKGINIYELAHKCKEWLLSKGYSYLSGKDDIYERGKGCVCSIGSTELLIKDFYANTEIEAIFKACQWILDNKGTKWE